MMIQAKTFLPVDIVYILGMTANEYENKLKQQAEMIERQAERIKQLEAKIDELKKLLAGKAEAKSAKKPKFTENYSLDKNARKKRRKKSTRRRSNDAKRALVEHQYDIFRVTLGPFPRPSGCKTN